MIKKSFLFSVFFLVILSFSFQKSFSFFGDASLKRVIACEVNEEFKLNKENSLLNSAYGIESPFIKVGNGLENIVEPFVKRVTKTHLNWKYLPGKFYKKKASVYDIIIANPQLYSLPGCITLHQLLI